MGGVLLLGGTVLIGRYLTSTSPNQPALALPKPLKSPSGSPVAGEAADRVSDGTTPSAGPPAAPTGAPPPAAPPPAAPPPASYPPAARPTGPNQSIDGAAEADGSTKVMGTSFRDVRDGNLSTFWSPVGPTGTVSIKWTAPVTVSRVIIREAPGGATIRSWRMRNHDTGAVLATGTSARTITFQSTVLSKITFEIVTADGTPRISEFETFAA